MANFLTIEPLNPLKFVEVNPSQSAAFHTKHFDDYLFADQIAEWEQTVEYENPWETGDAITIQFKSNLAPATVDIIDVYGNSQAQVTATGGSGGLIGQPFDVYVANVALNSLAAGCYYLKITAGDPLGTPIVMRSEWICVKDQHLRTVMIAYKNATNKDGVVFEQGLVFNLRVDARIGNMTPGSKDTIYEDQILREVMIRSYAYRTFKFTISFAKGVPDYIIDKLNRIFGCSYITIDGKQFVKNEGAKWERAGQATYPMAGWSIDLREGGANNGTKTVDGGANPDETASVVYNIWSKSFGPFDSNGTNTLIQLEEFTT